MKKIILPASTILAIALAPVDANADLRQEYNSGGCNRYYSDSDSRRSYFCTDSMNHVYSIYYVNGVNPSIYKYGQIGKSLPDATARNIKQFEIENDNLVQYQCRTQNLSDCSSPVKKYVYTYMKGRPQIRQTNQSTTPARKTKQSNDGVSPLSTISLETPDDYVTRGDAKYDLNDKVGACFDYKKAISLSSAKPIWQKNLVIVKHDSRCRTAQDYKSKCSSDGKTCMYYPVKP